ncbi:unnamed protein product [Pedinophyceae sp. YPF-701]|nr:unnamed protein product [Pedinophyceae sp. YPF-701]
MHAAAASDDELGRGLRFSRGLMPRDWTLAGLDEEDRQSCKDHALARDNESRKHLLGLVLHSGASPASAGRHAPVHDAYRAASTWLGHMIAGVWSGTKTMSSPLSLNAPQSSSLISRAADHGPRDRATSGAMRARNSARIMSLRVQTDDNTT